MKNWELELLKAIGYKKFGIPEHNRFIRSLHNKTDIELSTKQRKYLIGLFHNCHNHIPDYMDLCRKYLNIPFMTPEERADLRPGDKLLILPIEFWVPWRDRVIFYNIQILTLKKENKVTYHLINEELPNCQNIIFRWDGRAKNFRSYIARKATEHDITILPFVEGLLREDKMEPGRKEVQIRSVLQLD